MRSFSLLSSVTVDRLHVSFNKRSNEVSKKERAVGLANSAQVYIYIQYLFIYFSVYLFAFFLVVQTMHWSIVCCHCSKGTALLCVEHGCFKGGRGGDLTPSLDTACFFCFVTTNMVWISFFSALQYHEDIIHLWTTFFASARHLLTLFFS